MLPADKSNGNSLSGRSVYSSNPTLCNVRIVLSSYQNNLGVGSNKCAFNASNSFSKRRDSSKISGLRKVKYRRCVCRTCATNRTYSAACSGVIFAKFSICGHFVPSWYNLSIFLFAFLYGLGNGLFRGPSFFLGRLCYFGGFPCRFRGFLFDFRPIVCAIHEILYDSAPEMVALRTLFRTHLAPGVIRANRRYDNKDSVHYSNSTISGSSSNHRAASIAFSRVEKMALCFWDEAQ